CLFFELRINAQRSSSKAHEVKSAFSQALQAILVLRGWAVFLLPENLKASFVADHYCTPCQGRVPPLRDQFPSSFSLDNFEAALALLKQQYDQERSEWEAKYDLLFPELRYARRIHPLTECRIAEQIRQITIGQLSEEERPSSSDEFSKLDLELLCAQQWMMETIRDSLAKHEIPLTERNQDGEIVSDGVPYADRSPDLSPELWAIIALGRERYREQYQTLSRDAELMSGYHKLELLVDRCESLRYQCKLIRSYSSAPS
ncbi:MAG: hypothetical protein KDD42_05195, partial [Bdellovibrionales bacterium]|nr:hypothetical protein [Bdellovibrionales bacterium]